MHSSGKEDENTPITLNPESWKCKSLIKLLSTAPETTHQTAPKLESLYFPAQRFPPSLPSSIFLICCTLKATEELGRAAVQEGSAGLRRKRLALLLNSPGSAAASWVPGYRLLAPASSCNFSVVEKRDSFFSESPGAISRQCGRRQCLRNPRGHFKETVWNIEDQDTKEIFTGLQCDSRSVFFKIQQVFLFRKEDGATFYHPAINFL